ncbi:MAG: hypothetical protein IJC49_04010 [Clostridia bacterium]|nr:hypothetical protein [Clostridia bacterium]
MEKKEKQSVLGWFSNLWYYHKWHILVGALVLLVLGVSVVQCAKNEKPDISILYVADYDLGNTNRKEVEDFIASYYEDVTGDGRKTLSLVFMGENDKTTKDRLQTEVVAGEHTLYFVDKTNFDWLMKYNILAPLKDVMGEKPENALNDYGIELKYLDLAEVEGFNDMPRDTVVCLRGNREGGIDYGNSTALYKNNVKLFIDLLSYDIEGLVREDINMVMIGDRDLYENCVTDMEASLYYISKQKETMTVPLLRYETLQLKYKEGQHIFGDEEKAKVDALASGGKILLLDEDAYLYLSGKGALCEISALGIELPEKADKYGVMLKDLSLFETNGFYYADDHKNSRVYLCGTADIDGFSARVLGYLYEFKA